MSEHEQEAAAKLDTLVQRALSDPQVREALARGKAFEELTEMPAWKLMESAAGNQEDTFVGGLLRKAMQGDPVDQRELARMSWPRRTTVMWHGNGDE